MSKQHYALIDVFVDYLNSKAGDALKVTSYPDMVPGSSGDIDAIAEGPSGRLAIEHSSIDSVPHQRADDAAFAPFVRAVLEVVEGIFTFRAVVTLPARCTFAGRAAVLSNWLLRNLPAMQDGHGYHAVEGLPYRVHVWKRSEGWHPVVRVCRFAPEDYALPERLAVLLDRKTKKLKRYASQGYRTVLLIENEDLALMSPGMMIEAADYWRQQHPPVEPDELWYADTSIPGQSAFWQLDSH